MGKVAALQTGRPEFKPQKPHKTSTVSQASNSNTGEAQLASAWCSLAGQSTQQMPGLYEILLEAASKEQYGQCLRNTTQGWLWSPHSCTPPSHVHTCLHTSTHMHTLNEGSLKSHRKKVACLFNTAFQKFI